jgi:hypothetical protein
MHRTTRCVTGGLALTRTSQFQQFRTVTRQLRAGQLRADNCAPTIARSDNSAQDNCAPTIARKKGTIQIYFE